jgi:hypothetical protein
MTVHTKSPYQDGYTSCGFFLDECTVEGKPNCIVCLENNQHWHMAGVITVTPHVVCKQRDLLGITDEVICSRAGISHKTWLRFLRDCSKVSVDTVVRIGWAVEMNLSFVPDIRTPPSEQS